MLNEEKIKCLHHLIADSAKIFYITNVKGIYEHHSQAKWCWKENITVSRQNGIVAYFRNVFVSQNISTTYTVNDSIEKFHE